MEPEKRAAATRRHKVVWRVLLISNLALGAYIFARARKKDAGINRIHSKRETEISLPSVSNQSSLVTKEKLPPPNLPPLEPITKPVKVQEPIPVDQQRELFQWLLEEKRKIKPKNREEKKRNDEDNAILKQFIRAETSPIL